MDNNSGEKQGKASLILRQDIAPGAIGVHQLTLSSGIAIGDLYYGDGQGNIVRLAPGTSGQFLKSLGSAAPTWATLPTTTVRVSYGSLVPGNLTVANDLGVDPRVRTAATVTRISVHIKTAPTGASAILRVFNITQAVAVASVTLTASSTDATSTTITTPALVAGDILRFDCTQIGSTIAGADATLQIDATEP